MADTVREVNCARGGIVRFGVVLSVCFLVAFFAAHAWFRVDVHRPLSISKASIDFGRVGYFETPEAVLVLRNQGKIPLLVTLDADCSCVELSSPLIRMQPMSEHSIIVGLKRTPSGRIIDGVRHIQKQIDLAYSVDGVLVRSEVDLSVAFEEPLLVQDEARDAEAALFVDSAHKIGISAMETITEVEIVSVPDFVLAASVQWNDDFNSGWIHLTSNSHAVGLKQGEIVLDVLGKRGNTTRLKIPFSQTTAVPIRSIPEFVSFDASKNTAPVELELSAESDRISDIRIVGVESDDRLRVLVKDSNRLSISLSENEKEANSEKNVRAVHDIVLEVVVSGPRGEHVSFAKTVPVIFWD